MATGTIVMMQMKDRAQRLKPSVCFFFFFQIFTSFFFFILNVYFQEIYHNGNEWPLPPLSIKQMWMSNVHHRHHTNNGQKTGQSNRRDNRGSRHDMSQAPRYVSFHFLFIFYLLNIYLHLELLRCNCDDDEWPPPCTISSSSNCEHRYELYMCVCFTVLMTI